MPAIEVHDKALLRRRLARALARSGPGADFLLERAVADLAERLAAVERRFSVGIALLGTTGRLAEALLASGKVEAVFRIERVPGALQSGRGVVADEEALPLRPESVDLVASALALQWTNDLPGALVQIRQALRPDGLFFGSLLGGDTLAELRQAFSQAESEVRGGLSPRVTPFADVRDLGALLQRAGFALPVTDIEPVSVRYRDPFGLFRDLRAMGLTNALVDRRKTPLRRATLLRAAEIYAERFADADGRLRATFELLWLSGWAPHESQQKPLRPGSAKVRLADALGVKEHGGENSSQ
jgi:SAM-dependent methyltransferase